jgi:type IV pilus assembly protein PilB
MLNVMESILIQQLFNQKAINKNDIELLIKQGENYQTLPQALVLEEILTTAQLAKWSCILFDVNTFDIAKFDCKQWRLYDHALIKQQGPFLREHQILPISLHNQVVLLATADPSNLAIQDDFEFNTGLHTEFAFSDPVLLQQKIDQLIPIKSNLQSANINNASVKNDGGVNEKADSSAVLQGYSQKDLQSSQEPSPQNVTQGSNYKIAEVETEMVNDRSNLNQSSTEEITNNFIGQGDPIIAYVDKILRKGISQNASDLHFEPYENNYRIRFRIDGILINACNPPPNVFGRLAARIKVMANMDIAEKRKPQDGRLKLNTSKGQDVEFRVSTLPTIWGEKVVLRILDTKGYLADVSKLGFETHQQQDYIDALAQPQGLILVTGPTGSGKTLTLYSGLNFLNTEDRNISTIEDPVEYHLQGINQVQVNIKAQLDFASSLRAFLRQDPDVVMVGEIRDLETAQIAIKAAHTGHLVLSTLHTNSAAETLNRLTNMGIPSYNLASAISLIIAQRLVRCLCEYCKEPESHIPSSELIKQGFEPNQINNLSLYKAVGCRRCNQGYKGRISVFELLKPSELTRQLIMQGASAAVIQEEAVNAGMLSLRHAGLHKIISGVTSLEEVNRVTNN